MSINELMTGLADSVRLKTGKTGKMTLEQIAAAITSITVEGDLGFRCGTITASSSGAKTIQHGLGQVPGAVIFIKMATTAGSVAGTTVRDALISVVYGQDAGHSYCYHTIYRPSSSSSSTQTTQSRTWSHSSTTPSNMFGSGGSTSNFYVTNINETSFKTPSYLIAGKKYLWIAFRAPLV